MSDPVYTGAVGLVLRLTLLDEGAVHDPTGATKTEITIRAPDGTKSVKSALVGMDSSARPCLEYTTVAGEQDQPGTYHATGYIEDAAGQWPAAPVSWEVFRSDR